MRLVKNGQIVLDGTLSKAEKERLIFQDYEFFQTISENNKLDLKTILMIMYNGIVDMNNNLITYHLLLDLANQRFVNIATCYLKDEENDSWIETKAEITEYKFDDYGKTYKVIEK